MLHAFLSSIVLLLAFPLGPIFLGLLISGEKLRDCMDWDWSWLKDEQND